MSITLGGRQRDLLYDVVADRLTGIDDVWRAADEGAWERAQRLGREFSDLLRLVVDDLGWGRGREEAVDLMSPPDVLQRAIEAVRREAAVEDSEQREQRLAVAETQLERAETLEACDAVVAQLAAAC